MRLLSNKWFIINVLPTVVVIISFIIYEYIIHEFIYFDLFKPKIHNNATIVFYVLNLDRSPERFAAIKEQADQHGIQLTRFSAIDGSNVTLIDQDTANVISGLDLINKTKQLENLHNYYVFCTEQALVANEADYIYKAQNIYIQHEAFLSAGEIGVSCSYRKLWNELAYSKEEQIAIIFEDDIHLKPHFNHYLQKIFYAMPNHWDLIYLDAIKPIKARSFWLSRLFTIDNTLVQVCRTCDTWGLHAYIINSNTAKTLLSIHNRINNYPIDAVIIAAILAKDIKAYIVQEEILYVRDIPSEITKMGRIEFNTLSSNK